MSTPGGRFNFRTRKSLKLHGQIECTSCHRFYFSPEIFDEENYDDGDQSGAEKLCCDCEEKKRCEPPPKRRAMQRQNGVQTPISKTTTTTTTTPMTTIKQEKIDSIGSQANSNGHYDRLPSIANQNTVKGISDDFSENRMVQIHSSELLTQSMLPLNFKLTNVKKENINTAPDTIISNCKPKRAYRKKANAILCDETQNQSMTSDRVQDQVHVKAEALITQMDTIDSLREKFPKAGPFEFEFLMFLKGNQREK